MKIIELEKKVNELIKERNLIEEKLYFDDSCSKVESLIKEVLGKDYESDRIYFTSYGTRGKLLIKHHGTRNCITVTIKRKNNGTTGHWYSWTLYGIKSIEISKEYDTIEDFINEQNKEYNNQLDEDKKAYESLVADLKALGLDEQQFLKLKNRYDSLRFPYEKKFNGDKDWELYL